MNLAFKAAALIGVAIELIALLAIIYWAKRRQG